MGGTILGNTRRTFYISQSTEGMEDRENDGPDFEEAVKGAANLFDFAQRVMHGRDPQMRKSADRMDEVTVGDALNQMSDILATPKVSEGDVEGTKEPKVEAMDGDGGIDIVVDTAGTDVKPADMMFGSDDNEVVIKETASGWEKRIEINREYLPIEDVDADINGSVVTAEVDLGREAENIEETETEDTNETEMITISRSDTLNDIADQYPDITEKLEESGLPVSAARMMHGDKTVEELTDIVGIDVEQAIQMVDMDIEVEIVD